MKTAFRVHIVARGSLSYSQYSLGTAQEMGEIFSIMLQFKSKLTKMSKIVLGLLLVR